jgi:3-phenylpropionate/trans-cinnamate dioxygenase ferredoxin component
MRPFHDTTRGNRRGESLDNIAHSSDTDGRRRAADARGREDGMAAGELVRVAAVDDVAPGQAHVVEAGGRTLALFNVEGTFYALDNACAHRGGPLGEGDLEGRIVMCPWHAWRWDVTTGANANNPAVRMTCYPVRVEGGGVFVQLG